MNDHVLDFFDHVEWEIDDATPGRVRILREKDEAVLGEGANFPEAVAAAISRARSPTVRCRLHVAAALYEKPEQVLIDVSDLWGDDGSEDDDSEDEVDFDD